MSPDWNFWPYEELRVTRLDEPGAFRFETPWYASVIKTTEEGGALFERAFFSAAGELSPAELLPLYNQVFAPLLHEPYAYLLAPPASVADAAVPETSDPDPLSFARAHGLAEHLVPVQWSWDAGAILSLCGIPGTNSFSPMSLFSVFRRFFFLEAMDSDRTRSLYGDLTGVAGAGGVPAALAFIITQNLHVTRRCHDVLSAALPRAGRAEPVLREFIKAERGHDRIMERALEAFPGPRPEWSLRVSPATISLMDVFRSLAENDFLAFSFAIFLFERPQFEELHPVTRMLREQGLDEAARRYEVHHQINDDGDHGEIGVELIEKIPPLSAGQAVRAARWAEIMSRVMSAHSSALLDEIAAHREI